MKQIADILLFFMVIFTFIATIVWSIIGIFFPKIHRRIYAKQANYSKFWLDIYDHLLCGVLIVIGYSIWLILCACIIWSVLYKN